MRKGETDEQHFNRMMKRQYWPTDMMNPKGEQLTKKEWKAVNFKHALRETKRRMRKRFGPRRSKI